jgi:hypothetical protein
MILTMKPSVKRVNPKDAKSQICKNHDKTETNTDSTKKIEESETRVTSGEETPTLKTTTVTRVCSMFEVTVGKDDGVFYDKIVVIPIHLKQVSV